MGILIWPRVALAQTLPSPSRSRQPLPSRGPVTCLPPPALGLQPMSEGQTTYLCEPCSVWNACSCTTAELCLLFSQIIGCRVRRDPPDSTERYTRWINQLAPEQLLTQVMACLSWSRLSPRGSLLEPQGHVLLSACWPPIRAWFCLHSVHTQTGQSVLTGQCPGGAHTSPMEI